MRSLREGEEAADIDVNIDFYGTLLSPCLQSRGEVIGAAYRKIVINK